MAKTAGDKLLVIMSGNDHDSPLALGVWDRFVDAATLFGADVALCSTTRLPGDAVE